MQNVITIGRELVPVEQIAYFESFEPPANGQFKPDKPYKGRVVLLNRETVLTETAPQEFAETNGFRLLPRTTSPPIPRSRFGSRVLRRPTTSIRPSLTRPGSCGVVRTGTVTASCCLRSRKWSSRLRCAETPNPVPSARRGHVVRLSRGRRASALRRAQETLSPVFDDRRTDAVPGCCRHFSFPEIAKRAFRNHPGAFDQFLGLDVGLPCWNWMHRCTPGFGVNSAIRCNEVGHSSLCWPRSFNNGGQRDFDPFGCVLDLAAFGM
jgi:hypothetical protein